MERVVGRDMRFSNCTVPGSKAGPTRSSSGSYQLRQNRCCLLERDEKRCELRAYGDPIDSTRT